MVMAGILNVKISGVCIVCGFICCRILSYPHIIESFWRKYPNGPSFTLYSLKAPSATQELGCMRDGNKLLSPCFLVQMWRGECQKRMLLLEAPWGCNFTLGMQEVWGYNCANEGQLCLFFIAHRCPVKSWAVF